MDGVQVSTLGGGTKPEGSGLFVDLSTNGLLVTAIQIITMSKEQWNAVFPPQTSSDYKIIMDLHSSLMGKQFI